MKPLKRLFVPGVFDVFHVGHLNYLKNASRHGEYVIVGVQDDRAVFDCKGVKPVIPLFERVAIIEAMRFVNEVVSYTAVFQGPLLKGLDIQVLAVGDEYGQDERYPEQKRTLAYCAENQIKVVRIPRTPIVSSTSIRGRLKDFWNSRAQLDGKLSAGLTVLGSFKGDQGKIAAETRREVELILKAAEGASSLLDLGCGDGRQLVEVAPRFRRVVAVDFSGDLLKIARQRIAECGGHAELVEGDVVEFRTLEKFDTLLLSGIIPCLDDDQMARMLEGLAAMAYESSTVLVRSSIGLSARVDVVNQFSHDLNSCYTAFYRTIPEIEGLFAKVGWSLRRKEQLYQHQPDTAVWWFEFSRAQSSSEKSDPPNAAAMNVAAVFAD